MPVGQGAGRFVDGGVALIAGPYQWFLRRSDDPTRQGKRRVALPAATIDTAGDRCRGATGQKIAELGCSPGCIELQALVSQLTDRVSLARGDVKIAPRDDDLLVLAVGIA